MADDADTLDDALGAASETGSPAGDEAPAPHAGNAAPDEPAADSRPPAWEERYQNLHRRFGEQGNELGSLRQKLAAQENQIAEFSRFREELSRTRSRDAAEVEQRLTGFVRDPDGWIKERITPAEKRAEEAEKKIADLETRMFRQYWTNTVREFARDNPDATKYAQAIDQGLRRVPEHLWSREMLDDAYAAARWKANDRAEESARKKVDALTRDAALPKGTGAPGGAALPDRKPGDFASSVIRAKARQAKGG